MTRDLSPPRWFFFVEERCRLEYDVSRGRRAVFPVRGDSFPKSKGCLLNLKARVDTMGVVILSRSGNMRVDVVFARRRLSLLQDDVPG